MFVERLQKDNPKFVAAMVKLQQEGALLPDSYAVDMEQFRANAAAIVSSAKEKGIKLYFMLKQIGRNPVLAQELVKLGYDGAVVVDKILSSGKVGYGFDAYNEVYCDMMQAGIVDPTKVTRSALQNAASIASVVLTTESVVADKKDPAADAAAAAAMAGGAGMGGGMY